MRVRKLGLTFFAVVIALLIPFSTAFAALDYLGRYGLTINTGEKTGNLYYYRTEYVYSDGGSFKVCNYNMSSTKFFVYEYDPGSNNDDYVYSWTLGMSKCYTFTGLDKFKDGDNNKAELYVKSARASGGLAYERQVKLYD
jgi:hypothetical protein